VNGVGDEMYDAYTRSRLSNWSIIIGAPVSEVDQAVRRGVTITGVGLFIAMASALALTMFAGRHLVRYVDRASESASLLGRGGEVRSLPRSAIVELERLNEAILEASRRLQAEMNSRSQAERERNELLVRERQARASAEQQNAAKDEFLAMLGHELRNPLSAVASAVSILDNGASLPPAAAERARAVLRRQTGHLRKLVDDLLEVNRALMGKLTLQTEPVDLAEVVRRCVDTLQASGRLARFQLRVDSAAALVEADPTRLLQVVDNILDNAVKYSPEGGPLHVAVFTEGGDALLRVRDHGQGIAPELLPTVFDIFVQGKQSLQRQHGGLGIGLSLVRRLVELHGGSVAIDSCGTGQGATVTVRLPRLVSGAEPEPAAVMAAPAQEGVRVLLIEDNADAREMLSMLLELRGCTVLAADSGAAGIAIARAQQPDLALVDIGLPGMDGYEVAGILSADPATQGIALVALTGYGSDADRAHALAAGFSRHLTKPIKLEDLDEVLLPASSLATAR
jgi:signal transduction histidine kinase/CheY-like chemotaxis protein